MIEVFIALTLATFISIQVEQKDDILVKSEDPKQEYMCHERICEPPKDER